MRRHFARLATAAVVAVAAAATPAQVSAAEEAAKDEVKVGYDKGFFIKGEKASLTLGGRVQFRFTQPDLDGAAETDDAESSFTVPRARLTLGGHIYAPTVRYFIQYDLRGQDSVTSVSIADDGDGILEVGEVSTTRKRGTSLRDFWVELTKYKGAQLRVGQFKVPFGSQELTSSGSQQFVERSIASRQFAPARDQGAMVFGQFSGGKFGYMASVTNGETIGNAENFSANNNEELRWAARFNFDPAGEYKLEESAVEHPDKLNWTIGGAWTQTATDNAGDLDDSIANGFFGLKYKRLSVTAEYYDRTTETVTAAGDTDSDGFIAQAGLFLIPRKFEVAGRRSHVDPDDAVRGDLRKETRLGVNWYWLKHSYKLQLDYGIITADAAGLTAINGQTRTLAGEGEDREFRGQLQVRF